MSKPVEQQVNCPECGATQTVTFWDSIDAQASPSVRDALIDGSLFQHTCGECGAVSILNHPCVYRDPERGLLVYFMPDENELANVEDMLADMQSTQEIEGQWPPYRMRIVTTINDLREKAAAFDDELDDRVLEIVKAVFGVYARNSEPMAGKQIDMIYYAGYDEDGNLILYMLGPDVRESGTVPMAFYEKLEDALFYDSNSPKDSFYINYDWAMEWIEQSGLLDIPLESEDDAKQNDED